MDWMQNLFVREKLLRARTGLWGAVGVKPSFMQEVDFFELDLGLDFHQEKCEA